MNPTARSQPFGLWLRLLFAAAALDCFGIGLWAVAQPRGVFELLQLPALPEPQDVSNPLKPPRDRLFLWQLLGQLSLVHGALLIALLYRPREYGGLVAVPLIGRTLQTGLWLWLLGSERVTPRVEPLIGLAVHDTIWLLVFAGFLVVWWRRSDAW